MEKKTIAQFTVAIPKSAKSVAKYVGTEDSRLNCKYVALIPHCGLIAATDTHILQAINVQFEGVWPNTAPAFAALVDAVFDIAELLKKQAEEEAEQTAQAAETPQISTEAAELASCPAVGEKSAETPYCPQSEPPIAEEPEMEPYNAKYYFDKYGGDWRAAARDHDDALEGIRMQLFEYYAEPRKGGRLRSERLTELKRRYDEVLEQRGKVCRAIQQYARQCAPQPPEAPLNPTIPESNKAV